MQSRWVVIILGSLFALTSSSRSVHAQAQLRGMLTTGMGDIAAIKQKAEAGDAKAQVSLADSLIANFHAVDALTWYRKAAEQGNSEGACQVGRILLFGAPGIPKEQAIKPNPPEGIQWTFRAATNLHPHACWDMSKALQRGLGVSTNLVEAYAWLELFSKSSSGWSVGKVELNQLALKLDSPSIRRGQELADQFRHGNFSPPVTRTIPDGDQALRLSSISWGKTPLAIISGKTLAEGESANLKTKTGTQSIKCLKIEMDSVLVSLEGESAPRWLRLR
jgi:TPR repeat protein